MNNLYQDIYNDHSKLKIWKKLDNGCYIGTMGYSPKNAKILMKLLKSFEEQYGEEITLESAKEELMLYEKNGKLFVYFDEDLNPVSMNGITYNEDNVSVDFKSLNGYKPTNMYFYGLSTLPKYRGKGAGTSLIKFSIDYAYHNNFDLVYARTDLIGSNSEGILKRAGLNICKYEDSIITEWVDVTDSKGDYRLHLWMPLKNGLYTEPKNDALYADIKDRSIIEEKEKVLSR